ncbi:MAG: methylitaconate delta2-delta3-isomerase [Betaproteobacteria bacterium]|nr:MAG: methylitaconate delta2-delta3-isomerase [Betaproteobacteria bacterium]
MEASKPAMAPDDSQLAIPCLFMRGGSSRGGFFLEDDLPADPVERQAVLLACYGSPDERQIDGIGGADPLTSKAAIVGRSGTPGADVDYTFCQVGIGEAKVSTGGNCGNMLAAVGPFALLKGLVSPVEPETLIRIYTTNTRQIITARVPTAGGRPNWDGTCTIPGVPGSGAPVYLDFGNCAGSVSGKLLPTGAAADVIEVNGLHIKVSLVDAATPFVFVDARELGTSGTELPDALRANSRLMERLEGVRGWAATVLGLARTRELARKQSPNVPRVMMVSPPQSYLTSDGTEAQAHSMDLCARQLAMQRPHKALAVTGAVCVAVAAAVPGSVVAECAGGTKGELRVGHPSGVLHVSSRVVPDRETGQRIESAVIQRTARLIMSGYVHARRTSVHALVSALSKEGI